MFIGTTELAASNFFSKLEEINPCQRWNESKSVLVIQRRIQDPAKHLRWSILLKQLTAKSRYMFFQKIAS